jgi:hypothetical protein
MGTSGARNGGLCSRVRFLLIKHGFLVDHFEERERVL